MTQLYVADTGIYAHKYSRTAHIIGYLINAAEKSVYTTIIRQKIIASFACRPSRLIKQFRWYLGLGLGPYQQQNTGSY